MADPRVALIIPTLKRERPLVETLESVLNIDYPEDRLAVIVVDQTPVHEIETQRCLEALEKSGKIQWFRPPEITFASLTKARNFGLARVPDAEFAVFVDDDVEVRPDFLRQHLAAYADPAVGATVGKVTVPGHAYPPPPFTVGKVSWWGRFIDNLHGDEPVESDTVIGCNFSLRMSILEKTGRFDEEFIGNAMREDADMALRVREAGLKIRFLPGAALIHKQVATGGTRVEARLAWYFSLFHNDFLFYAKHAPLWRIPFFAMQMWRPILACWLFYGKGSLRAFLKPWQGIASGLRAARRAKAAGRAVPRGGRQVQVF